LKYGNLKVNEIIFELLLGTLRVRERWAGELVWTSFEEASREEMLGEFLPMAERAPYEYFMQAGMGSDRYLNLAIQHFSEKGAVNVRKHAVARGGYVSKGLRLASAQPAFEMGRIYVVDTIDHWESFSGQIETARMDVKTGFDIADCLADLVREGYPPRPKKKPETRTHDFAISNMRAMRLNYARRRLLGGRVQL